MKISDILWEDACKSLVGLQLRGLKGNTITIYHFNPDGRYPEHWIRYINEDDAVVESAFFENMLDLEIINLEKWEKSNRKLIREISNEGLEVINCNIEDTIILYDKSVELIEKAIKSKYNRGSKSSIHIKRCIAEKDFYYKRISTSFKRFERVSDILDKAESVS